MGYTASAAVFGGVKIGIQYARTACKLEFSCRWFGYVQLGISKQPNELTSGLAHDDIEARYRLERGRRSGWQTGPRCRRRRGAGSQCRQAEQYKKFGFHADYSSFFR